MCHGYAFNKTYCCYQEGKTRTKSFPEMIVHMSYIFLPLASKNMVQTISREMNPSELVATSAQAGRLVI